MRSGCARRPWSTINSVIGKSPTVVPTSWRASLAVGGPWNLAKVVLQTQTLQCLADPAPSGSLPLPILVEKQPPRQPGGPACVLQATKKGFEHSSPESCLPSVQ